MTNAEKRWTVMAPVGNVVVPKESMNEQELRNYAAQISVDLVWKEKALKDPIEEVLEWLGQAGYNITG